MPNGRTVNVFSGLGSGVLLFQSMRVREELGRLFRADVDLLSENAHIPPDDVLGKGMTVVLVLPGGGLRYFHGLCTRFSQTGRVGHLVRYEATLRPWLWFLTRTADCRIYPKREDAKSLTVPDIIKEVFRRNGFSDFKDELGGTAYKPREFTVQYRETDLDFITRLMEEEGIYYYILHEANKHTVVLADGPSSHKALKGYEKIPYIPADQQSLGRQEHIHQWFYSKAVQPGGIQLVDYDFEQPKSDLFVKASFKAAHPGGEFKIFDYPGGHVGAQEADDAEPGDSDAMDRGTLIAQTQVESWVARHEVMSGLSNARGLAPGNLFTLVNYHRKDQNREYLITSAEYEISVSDYEGRESKSSEVDFGCFFTAVPSKVPYRLEKLTPRPYIRGPQTAKVVGKDGEEIWTDKYGRVKVQFHWDHEGGEDENSSCWVRVAQVWAGRNWGGIHIPRIGQEVIVEFLEGNPDRPLVTGRLYNADNMPPYDLPGNKTQSGIKSRSSKGGGPTNYNELRFEDLKGSEEVFLHAEKNLKIHVKSNETETVGANITTSAGSNITRNAGNNISRTADKNILDKAGENLNVEAVKDMVLKAGGSYSLLTNLGIQLKAMNFVAALIESGAKAAADAVKKGAGKAAAETAAAGAQAAVEGGGGAGLSSAYETGTAAGGQAAMSGLAALSPGIEAGAAELTRLSNEFGTGVQGLDTPVNSAIEASARLGDSIAAGASPEQIATDFMAMASAVADAFEQAQKVLEAMLPQFPSISLWAMKDINALALWSMTLETKVKNIDIKASNKDVNISGKQNVGIEAEKADFKLKAKKNIKLEASEKDIEVKATKENIKVTGKKVVTIKSEDDNLIIEAGKKKVFVKASKQIFLKCGSASLSMADSGNIVIKGAKVNIKGDAVSVKGNPVKLN